MLQGAETKQKNSLQGQTSSLHNLTTDAVFTVILVVLGMIKLPSLIPGAEFQLSAPYAVCLASVVGFKRYLCIGICSSLIQFMLGTHTVWNVLIAMVFRIVAGLILTFLPNNRLVVAISGPAGTAAARTVIAAVLNLPLWPLLAAAAPGMVFTAIASLILLPVFRRIMGQSA